MLKEYRIYIYIVLAIGSWAYAVSFVPALTSGGTMSAASINEQAYNAAFGQELNYCREQPDDLDCQCFAHLSAIVQADDQPRIPNVLYADKQELARWQAADSC